jgi:hypothetical protein
MITLEALPEWTLTEVELSPIRVSLSHGNEALRDFGE